MELSSYLKPGATPRAIPPVAGRRVELPSVWTMIGGFVAAIGIVQQAVGGVKDGVQESDEHSGLVLLVEEIVDFGQDGPRGARRLWPSP